jgi:hypothetical protein
LEIGFFINQLAAFLADDSLAKREFAKVFQAKLLPGGVITALAGGLFAGWAFVFAIR